jgi:hypothetical protein
MKQLFTIRTLITLLLISLLQNELSQSSFYLTEYQLVSNNIETVINAPDNILPACLLPENGTNQFHYSKNPVSENRLIRPGFSPLPHETHGSMHSAVEYFENSDQILLRLSISAIIFPFNYHW